MAITVAQICRYPVKGLSAERLEAVELAAGQRLPDDRRFALAHAASRFDPHAPAWQPKSEFLTLVRHDRLALLAVRFDPEAGTLTIERAGKQVVRGRPGEPSGRAILDQFFSAFLASESQGPVRLVDGPGVAFTDSPEPVVSVINLASVRDLERVVGAPVDPLRFRGNFYIEGAEAWQEFGWLEKEFSLGAARLRGVERIGRCAATNIDPESAARDRNIPLALERGFGHGDLGLYARVIEGGRVRRGDTAAAPA